MTFEEYWRTSPECWMRDVYLKLGIVKPKPKEEPKGGDADRPA